MTFQPRSQGLSSNGKMRDPGKEVDDVWVENILSCDLSKGLS